MELGPIVDDVVEAWKMEKLEALERIRIEILAYDPYFAYLEARAFFADFMVEAAEERDECLPFPKKITKELTEFLGEVDKVITQKGEYHAGKGDN